MCCAALQVELERINGSLGIGLDDYNRINQMHEGGAAALNGHIELYDQVRTARPRAMRLHGQCMQSSLA